MTRRTDTVDVVSGLAFTATAAVFWSQRHYTSQYGGVFPDAVLALMALLGLVLALRGALRAKPPAGDDREPVPAAGLARAVLLLAAWVAALPVLGYLVGGAAFFFATALLVRKKRPGARDIALDLAVSVGVVLAFHLLFTQALAVRLPELAL